MFDRPLDCLIDPDALPAGQPVREVRAVRPDRLSTLLHGLPPADAAWLRAQGFAAKSGELVMLPGADGIAGAVLGLGQLRPGETQGPHAFGGLATGLATGVAPPSDDAAADPGTDPGTDAGTRSGTDSGTELGTELGAPWRLLLPYDVAEGDAVLGYCLGAYRFDRCRSKPRPKPARLVQSLLLGSGAPGLGAAEGAAIARATWLARDLINMPANLLGPAELAEAGRAVMAGFGASAGVVSGDALTARYPAIQAVGAGSERPPQVLLAHWRGSTATDGSPLLSLVGKGVCFDTGGYDMKPSAAMLRMKKDMGGAAIMLALARLVMEHDLPVRLSLRIGCVENSVSGRAMRPSDVLRTAKGLTVEVGNTDAEGRLVLADLLAEAALEAPSLLLDAATLTGAARTALGPDLPALFSNDDGIAAALVESGQRQHDPLWRLPLWPGYDDWLSSTVADLNNVSSRPMAGAVTAALFLQRFVTRSVRWAHVDTYAWNDRDRPGRPEGGEALGLRAMYGAVLQILNAAR